ncbi:MAG: ACT domain-containing protein [Phycisphaerae bacterium]|nr:ACT domain-containing protein [Phycisphaerae bacterium]
MKLKQLSIFLENQTGNLSGPCKILSQNNINILTLSVADTEQFGIMRLIVADCDKAKTALEQAGYVVNVAEVVAIEVGDQPGSLGEVLAIIEKHNFNVEYMYAFSGDLKEKAILVFRFEDTDKAIKVLCDDGVNVIKAVELYN